MRKRLFSLLGTGVLAFLGTVAAQVKIAHRSINAVDLPPPPDPSGWYGLAEHGSTDPVRVAILGDSLASGYGLFDASHTMGARLGGALVDQLHRPVLVRDFSIVGAPTHQLHHQVGQAIDFDADVAVVTIGAIDVVKMTLPFVAAGHLERQVRRMREVGMQVVVGTCPDFASVRPIRRPTRWIARTWSRRLAQQQARRAAAAGARIVPLGALLARRFIHEPDRHFGPDNFHPNVEGYALLADVVLPSVSEAVIDLPRVTKGSTGVGASAR